MAHELPIAVSRRRFVVEAGLAAGACAASAFLAPGEALAMSGGESVAGQKEGVSMATRQITVERLSITSKKPFHEVITSLEGQIGHPDVSAVRAEITKAQNFQEVESIVNSAVGPSGFMEFARYDLGEIVRKEQGAKAPRVVRLVIGNPLIMKRMVEHIPDAGSYAPVTILIDERRDGVHLSYDTMASYLAPYGNAEASKVARELDAKVEALLATTAG